MPPGSMQGSFRGMPPQTMPPGSMGGPMMGGPMMGGAPFGPGSGQYMPNVSRPAMTSVANPPIAPGDRHGSATVQEGEVAGAACPRDWLVERQQVHPAWRRGGRRDHWRRHIARTRPPFRAEEFRRVLHDGALEVLPDHLHFPLRGVGEGAEGRPEHVQRELAEPAGRGVLAVHLRGRGGPGERRLLHGEGSRHLLPSRRCKAVARAVAHAVLDWRFAGGDDEAAPRNHSAADAAWPRRADGVHDLLARIATDRRDDARALRAADAFDRIGDRHGTAVRSLHDLDALEVRRVLRLHLAVREADALNGEREGLSVDRRRVETESRQVRAILDDASGVEEPNAELRRARREELKAPCRARLLHFEEVRLQV